MLKKMDIYFTDFIKTRFCIIFSGFWSKYLQIHISGYMMRKTHKVHNVHAIFSKSFIIYFIYIGSNH